MDTRFRESRNHATYDKRRHLSKGWVCRAKLGRLEKRAERLFCPGERWPGQQRVLGPRADCSSSSTSAAADTLPLLW